MWQHDQRVQKEVVVDVRKIVLSVPGGKENGERQRDFASIW
jgi:hypothetical protein